MIVTKIKSGRWLWLLLAFVLLASVIAKRGFVSQASVSVFYPNSCLGGWQNPQRAALAPDGSFATLENATADIFCGNFQGDIPDDAEPKKFVLKFSWQINDAPPPPTIIHSANLEGKASEVLDAPAGAVLDTTPEPSAPPEVSPAPTEASQPASPASPAGGQNDAVWLPVFSTAFASTTDDLIPDVTTESSSSEPTAPIESTIMVEPTSTVPVLATSTTNLSEATTAVAVLAEATSTEIAPDQSAGNNWPECGGR